jgi:hypothetical protein
MVVGADHRGRAGVGIWRDAATGPLTALGQRPGHGWHSCWTRPTAWRCGRSVQAQRANPQPCRPTGRGVRSRVGPVVLGHREQFVAGRPRRSASRYNAAVGVGLTAAQPHSSCAHDLPPAESGAPFQTAFHRAASELGPAGSGRHLHSGAGRPCRVHSEYTDGEPEPARDRNDYVSVSAVYCIWCCLRWSGRRSRPSSRFLSCRVNLVE